MQSSSRTRKRPSSDLDNDHPKETDRTVQTRDETKKDYIPERDPKRLKSHPDSPFLPTSSLQGSSSDSDTPLVICTNTSTSYHIEKETTNPVSICLPPPSSSLLYSDSNTTRNGSIWSKDSYPSRHPNSVKLGDSSSFLVTPHSDLLSSSSSTEMEKTSLTIHMIPSTARVMVPHAVPPVATAGTTVKSTNTPTTATLTDTDVKANMSLPNKTRKKNTNSIRVDKSQWEDSNVIESTAMKRSVSSIICPFMFQCIKYCLVGCIGILIGCSYSDLYHDSPWIQTIPIPSFTNQISSSLLSFPFLYLKENRPTAETVDTNSTSALVPPLSSCTSSCSFTLEQDLLHSCYLRADQYRNEIQIWKDQVESLTKDIVQNFTTLWIPLQQSILTCEEKVHSLETYMMEQNIVRSVIVDQERSCHQGMDAIEELDPGKEESSQNQEEKCDSNASPIATITPSLCTIPSLTSLSSYPSMVVLDQTITTLLQINQHVQQEFSLCKMELWNQKEQAMAALSSVAKIANKNKLDSMKKESEERIQRLLQDTIDVMSWTSHPERILQGD